MASTSEGSPSKKCKVESDEAKTEQSKGDGLMTRRERFENLLKTGKYADCTFLVGNEKDQQTFQAHKLLLAMASPVMEAMFFGPLKEEGTVNITDVSPKTFEYFLQYVYTGEITGIPQEDAMSLYYASDKYLMPELKEKSAVCIGEATTKNNIWKAFDFYMLTKDETVLRYATSVLTRHASDVLRMKEVEDMDVQILNLILDKSHLSIHSDAPVFNAAFCWAKKECERKNLPPTKENVRATLGDGFKKIRFLTFDTEEFINGPWVSGILTRQEIDCALKGILCPKTVPYLSTICTERKSRWCGYL